MTSTTSPRWRLWLPLLIGAGALALFGNKTPDAATGWATPPPKAQHRSPPEGLLQDPKTAGVARHERSAEAWAEMLPLDRAQLFPLTPARQPTRDLFAAGSWLPAPAPPRPAEPPRSDTPAALPVLTVLGKKYEAAVWEVYLARGDQTLIAREGMSLDGGLRVDSIAPPTMNLTLPSTGQTLTLNIGEAR